MKKLKLNCDVGEGHDDIDALVMPHIDMANIACGGHAGDDETMLRTVALCKKHQVAVGAHPSYPDRENFGRISIELPAEALFQSLVVQIKRLQNHCRSLKARIAYVKPHGALYNDLLQRTDLFEVMARAIKSIVPNVPMMILATSNNTSFLQQGHTTGVGLLFEAFADRAYTDTGELVSRQYSHAVLNKTPSIVEQVTMIAQHQQVISDNGRAIPIQADSICVHSDTPNAVLAVLAIKEFLHSDT